MMYSIGVLDSSGIPHAHLTAGSAPGMTNPPAPTVRSCIRTTLLPRKQVQALLSAAQCSVEAVRALMRTGVDIDARDEAGNTAMTLATVRGDLEAVKRLKRNGAWIDCRGKDQQTPLMLASLSGNLALVKKLLSWDADPNRKACIDWTALYLATCREHVVIVDMLCKAGANVHAEVLGVGSPLQVAASRGHVGTLACLLRYCTDIDLPDTAGNTPFLSAVSKNHVKTASLLISANCNVFIKDSEADRIAISNGSTAMLDALSLHPRWKATLAQRHDPASLFRLAFDKGHDKVMRWLKDAGLSFQADASMLIAAIARRNANMVDFLLESGASAIAENADGITPIWQAVDTGAPEIVRSLLAREIDMLALLHRELLLHHAVQKGQAEIVALLLAKGAWYKLNPKAVMLAAENGLAEIASLLLDAGFAFATSNNARSAALIAAERGHVEVLRVLRKKGAGGDTQQSRSQLERAIHEGRVDIVALLLETDCEADEALLQLACDAVKPSMDIIDLILAQMYPLSADNPMGLRNDDPRRTPSLAPLVDGLLDLVGRGEKACDDWLLKQGMRWTNRRVLLDVAAQVKAIAPAMDIAGKQACETQLHALFGLQLLRMDASETGGTAWHRMVNRDVREQRRALLNAGKAMFESIQKPSLRNLIELCLAHSGMNLSIDRLAQALNRQAAFLPPMAQRLAACWKRTLDSAFDTLDYAGRMAEFPAFLQQRMLPLFAQELLTNLSEGRMPAWAIERKLPDKSAQEVAQSLIHVQLAMWQSHCNDHLKASRPTSAIAERLPVVAELPAAAMATTMPSTSALPVPDPASLAPINTRGDTRITSTPSHPSASSSGQPAANSS